MASRRPRREYLTMHHPQMNHRRGSLEARGDGSPLPPPPAMASNLSADSRCQLGMPQPPGGPRIRHPLDFCTLRRPGGRTVQFADQQQNVSFLEKNDNKQNCGENIANSVRGLKTLRKYEMCE